MSLLPGQSGRRQVTSKQMVSKATELESRRRWWRWDWSGDTLNYYQKHDTLGHLLHQRKQKQKYILGGTCQAEYISRCCLEEFLQSCSSKNA